MPRCQITPEVGHRWDWTIDGRRVTQWCSAPSDPRPCFYPLIGPSSVSLTRMGHPGAPDHDHHRSVWFAHNLVMGVNFWADGTGARVVQRRWLAIEDGDEWGGMAVELEWLDGHNPAPLLHQTLVAIMYPDEQRQWQLEIQSDFEARNGAIELAASNFGIFAVRLAKSLSVAFGGGRLRCSEGREGEPRIFEQTARWVDYSGPVEVWEASQPRQVTEGVTYFDHPSNPSYPSRWHVRSDGWMTASTSQPNGIVIDAEHPLRVRYLLDVHAGELDSERANRIASEFAARPAWLVRRSERPHRHFDLLPTDA